MRCQGWRIKRSTDGAYYHPYGWRPRSDTIYPCVTRWMHPEGIYMLGVWCTWEAVW